jgi:hypothetical protein
MELALSRMSIAQIERSTLLQFCNARAEAVPLPTYGHLIINHDPLKSIHPTTSHAISRSPINTEIRRVAHPPKLISLEGSWTMKIFYRGEAMTK